MSKQASIILFASGSGTNAENIIRYSQSHDFSVSAVFCNKTGAGVIDRAASYDVPVVLFDRAQMQSGELLERIKELNPDLIVLAGFLWLVPSELVVSFADRIINIHPALLPSYGGKGMYGEKVHNAVIEAGEIQSGITIHYVNEAYDEGDIIFQASCPVLPDDTPASLALRIHELEYEHYPKVIEGLLKEV